jgi:hypothetical protein
MSNKFTPWEKMTEAEKEAWRAQRDARIQSADERLQAGVEAMLQSQHWTDWLKFKSRCYSYSFANCMMILLQKPDATIVGSYKFWQSLGRYPRGKGLGISIFVPLKRKEPEPEESAGHEPAGGAAAGVKKTKSIRFGLGSVYDISDTDGASLPDIPVSLLSGDDKFLYLGLCQYIRNVLGCPVEEVDLPFPHNGRCDYDKEGRVEKILIKADNPQLQKAKTAVHEAAHGLLHSAVEYRQHTPASVMELEAESVAYIVLDHFGLEAGDYSFGYLASWSEGSSEALKAVKANGSRIANTAKNILQWLEENSGCQPIQVDLGMAVEMAEA